MEIVQWLRLQGCVWLCLWCRLHAKVEDQWFLSEAGDDFFCDKFQEIEAKVKWLKVYHGLNIIPSFFSTPLFRPELERLFPNRYGWNKVLLAKFPANTCLQAVGFCGQPFVDGVLTHLNKVAKP